MTRERECGRRRAGLFTYGDDMVTVALATHAASAPDGVTVEGEELEDAGAAEEVSQAGAVDRAQTKALSSLPV